MLCRIEGEPDSDSSHAKAAHIPPSIFFFFLLLPPTRTYTLPSTRLPFPDCCSMSLAFDYRPKYPIIADSPATPTEGHSFDIPSWRASPDPFALKGDPFDIPGDAPSSPDLAHDLPSDPCSTSDSAVPGPGLSPAALFLSAFSPPSTHARLPDDEGQSVAGYVLGPIIGHGGFSTIRRASSPAGGGIVAVKIVKHSEIDRQKNPCLTKRRLDHETQIWASLNHEHILPLFTVQHTSYADFFVMLYCPAGSLYDILRRDGNPALPLDEVGMMFRQIVRGVRYLHEVAGYVHRDIKLENVLVDEMGVCRIADFGLARKIGEVDEGEPQPDVDDAAGVHRHHSTISHTRHKMSSLRAARHHHQGPRRHRISTPVGDDSRHVTHGFPAGSLPYAAPELLSPSPSARHIRAHPAHDMWALGVLLYALLTGRLPFSDSFEPRLTMKILHGECYLLSMRCASVQTECSWYDREKGSFEMPRSICRAADRVLRGCLERSMRSRWTIAMVDEVAWGIGWGGEEADDDDDLASSDHHGDEFELVDYPSRRVSRSCSRARTSYYGDDDDDDNDDAHLGPIRQSRSRSRPGRSHSHMSITTTTSSSLSTRSASRSVSRPRVQLLSPDSALRDLLHTHTVRPHSDLSQSVLSNGSSMSGGKGSALFGFGEEERGRRPGSKQARGVDADLLGLDHILDDANAPVCGVMYTDTGASRSPARASAAVEKLRALVDAQRVTVTGRRSDSAPPRAVPVPEVSFSTFNAQAASMRVEDGNVDVDSGSNAHTKSGTAPILIVERPTGDATGTRRSRSAGYRWRGGV